ncbi:MAG TPA: amino acid racemase [Rhodothermia bacterium]|nr:amino acid racemase [Rhodothermia bacterium]
MKTIGIIGGIGPETTIAYYGQIIDAHRARVNDGSYPSMVISSIDAKRLIGPIMAGKHDEVVEVLLSEIARLERAGASFAAIAANTPHIVFDALEARSPLPLVSIVEATADAALERGIRKPALLGTRPTMDGTFYSDVFARNGMTIVIPDPADREYIHEKYMGELFHNKISADTRVALVSIISALVERDGIDGVILGGTELSLILTEPSYEGIPVLDTTRIHVQRIVDESLA